VFLQAHLKLLFNSFIDEEVAWILSMYCPGCKQVNHFSNLSLNAAAALHLNDQIPVPALSGAVFWYRAALLNALRARVLTLVIKSMFSVSLCEVPRLHIANDSRHARGENE